MTETDERVLCVTRYAAELAVVAGDTAKQLEYLLSQKTYRYRHIPNEDGAAVEYDDRWKQLIPYIVVVDKDDRVLAFNRGWKGGEDRLKGRWAIGFGGHVNDGDETFLLGVLREIREELEVGPIGITGTPCDNGEWSPLHGPIGFINDDSDDVGRKHLGVVYVLEASKVTTKENPEWGWQELSHLSMSQWWGQHLESWAMLALPMVRAWIGERGA